MIVVDSSVWIAQLRAVDSDKVRQLEAIRATSDILVGDLVMLEVLQGARDDRHAARIERDLRQFRLVKMLDPTIAVEAARHFRALRERSVTIRKTIDVIIATFCILGGHALLHADRDFDPFVEHLGLQTF